jgi:uncharacterized membrane protein
MDEHARSRDSILGAVCLGYLALRLWALTDSCLWFDEIFSVHAAEHSWSEIFWFVAQDLIHPPLFYLLLKVWIAAGGESLFWLRLFPVLFSLLAVWPFYLLCRELRLRFTSIGLALVFFSVNGALIKYAQEVRMYSLLLFLSLVSLWLFTRFFFRGKNIWILTIVNALMIYTHYFGWFVVTAEVLAIFLFQRIKIRHVLIMFGIQMLVFVPWIWALLKAAGTGAGVEQNIGWIARPGISAILDFVFDIVEPFYFQQSNTQPSSLLYISVPILVVIGVAKLWYVAAWKRHDRKEVLYLLSMFAVIPVLLVFALSWLTPLSIWGSRHLIIVFAPVSIAAAIYLTSIEIKPLRYAVIGIVLIVLGVAFVLKTQREKQEFIWCKWEEAVATVPRDGAVVYAFEDLAAYHLWFATRKDNVKIVKMNGIPEMTEDPAYFIPRGFDGIDVMSAGDPGAERFLFSFRDTEWNEQHPPVNFLAAKGYKIRKAGESQPAQGMRAFLGEAVK